MSNSNQNPSKQSLEAVLETRSIALYEQPMETPPIQVVNHYDEDSAYMIYQHPYRPGVNTRQRHWVETRKNYGQRHVYQTLNPYTNKWLVVKPSQYVDLVVLTLCDDYTHPACGQILPLFFTLHRLTNQELFDLTLRYSYTQYQREQILKELNARGFIQPPPWREDPQINLKLAHQAENPLPWHMRVERLTTPEGIVCETFDAAQHRVRKERRAAKEAEYAARGETIPTRARSKSGNKPIDENNADAVRDSLTPEQQAMFDDLMSPSSD